MSRSPYLWHNIAHYNPFHLAQILQGFPLLMQVFWGYLQAYWQEPSQERHGQLSLY